ncbi:uncharacterized protein LOC113367238 [Ctenocephalides felis]|uniref:uncharacterized protein LOC113367238 n=1 Tax=Ctenocephalides felis TaxID=7515 RepID=UPI000E6E3F84|nr:uncharacterized protein LOC113367238 [Ctenocephalides felis]
MAHKKIFRGFIPNLKRYSGAMILLAGDFRQTLPVIPRSTPADKLNACLRSSNLWKNVKVLHLSKNMRVKLQNDQSGNIFSKQLIDIGNGNFPIDMLTECINFPQNFCHLPQSKKELIQQVFPDVAQNYRNHDWLSKRAKLAAKNIDQFIDFPKLLNITKDTSKTFIHSAQQIINSLKALDIGVDNRLPYIYAIE